MTDQPTAKTKQKRPLWKSLLFRLLAVALSLLPLVLLEVGFRLCDVGKPTDYDDPFVGFSDIQPLFVLSDDEERYVIARSRQTHFRPDSFAANKSDNEFRIFVLGGSTVQGRPYAIETSFTTFLELALNEADPSRLWQVVNCGGVSYASYRLTPILREVLEYEPDLIILCTGHNEFLEDRTYAHIKNVTNVVQWSQRQASRLRTFNLLRAGWHHFMEESTDESQDRTQLGAEADARLDWQGGLAKYHRDEDWKQRVQGHFEVSVHGMTQIAQKANVPMLMVVPVSNLEWPPFKSQHRSDITEEERIEFAQLVEKARQLSKQDGQQAIELFESALEIDSQFAQTHYELGTLQMVLGYFNDAKVSLSQAIEEDICPLRMLAPMRERMAAIAKETSMPFLNAHDFFAAKCRGGIVSRDWLVDHVHPGVEGHQALANAIAEKLEEMQIVELGNDWQALAVQSWQKHIDSLEDDYFPVGQQRLKAVQRWARGQTDKVRPEDQPAK